MGSVLIPLGLLMLCVAVAAFAWAASSGQFDDLEGEGSRILFDDEAAPAPTRTGPPAQGGKP